MFVLPVQSSLQVVIDGPHAEVRYDMHSNNLAPQSSIGAFVTG